jgi:hypothetical protein
MPLHIFVPEVSFSASWEVVPGYKAIEQLLSEHSDPGLVILRWKEGEPTPL